MFRFADPPRLVALRIKPKFGGGRLWIPLTPVSLFTLHQIWVDRLYSAGLPSTARTIVDLGANIGLTARWLLSEFPGSHLVAVEPEPSNVAVLERNLKGLPSASVVQGCIAPHDGEQYLQLAQQADSHRVANGPGEGTLRVAAVSMPTLLSRTGMDRVDLLKMDIEGAEGALLENCGEWIGRVKCIIIELHQKELPIAELERRMASHGFRVDRSPWFAEDRIATCTNLALAES